MNGQLHSTVTGELFRGKGLSSIKQVLDRKEIDKLYIISNNVFANIYENQYNNINCDFNGTFVYWELNKDSKGSKWINY